MKKVFIVLYIIILIIEIFETYRKVKKDSNNNISYFILPISGFSIAAAATSNKEISKGDLAIILGVFAFSYAIYCSICYFLHLLYRYKKGKQ